MARQKFLNKNFPSMNMSEEEKEKKSKLLNAQFKDKTGAALSDAEYQLLMKNLLEERIK